MAKRMGYNKDNMVVDATLFGTATDPADGEQVRGFTAPFAGMVLGVAIAWSGNVPAAFFLRIGGDPAYAITVGANGAENVPIVGRVHFAVDDVVEVVSNGDQTGTATATLMFATA